MGYGTPYTKQEVLIAFREWVKREHKFLTIDPYYLDLIKFVIDDYEKELDGN